MLGFNQVHPAAEEADDVLCPHSVILNAPAIGLKQEIIQLMRARLIAATNSNINERRFDASKRRNNEG